MSLHSVVLTKNILHDKKSSAFAHNTIKQMKIVIIGGVAGGASAAARARRMSEDAEIILLQRDKDVSYASCGT